MSDGIRLLRSQIARIVGNDPRAIRAFEELFTQTTDAIPSNVQDVQIAAGNAEAMALQALGAIDRLFTVVRVSANTAIRGMQFADVDASGGAVTITLPPSSENVGRICGVAKNDSSSNAVTISGDVNGESSVVTAVQYTALFFVSVGHEWRLW